MFYPGTPAVLGAAVRGYLAEARSSPDADAPLPKAIIVPHAGYVYSGPVAAQGRGSARDAPGRAAPRGGSCLAPP